MALLNKIFGDANEKYLKKLQPIIDKINFLEPELEKLSGESLKEKTLELKERLGKGETLDDLLWEAFALVREAAKRTLEQRHYDVQLIGGIVLHQGKIAEMKTGEGKTLAATLPLYLNALEGKGCHLVTVNDYLAKRDAIWMGQIYHFLGLSVGCITHDQSYVYDSSYIGQKEGQENGISNSQFLISKQNQKSKIQIQDNGRDKERDLLGGFKVVESYLRPVSRREAYEADITYGTNNEFGFDYLRDNLVYDLQQQVQRGFNYAIVDEVDSILIDEARTPLIISAPEREPEEEYYYFASLGEKLKNNEDYLLDEKRKSMEWSEQGQDRVVKMLSRDPWLEGDFKAVHKLENAVKAKEFFLLDREYVIKNNEIIIVDEFTGRLMPGRRWSGSLHQAIEAKENVRGHNEVKAKAESMTLASVTFQNYFRMYKKLSGMTGTASTSAEEFDKVYQLEVIVAPTNKPMIRKDLPDRIYKTLEGKLQAVVREIKEKYETMQPVLVGTTSVQNNEYLGKLLEREGIAHQILNAKHHEREGEIIAQAGKPGAVTVATNMAGRGVDIVLGGNPPNPEETGKIKELGGLHIIGTERHEARRIDNQLRGRAGRQGDQGSSQFFVSLEDDLMRIFGGDRIKSLMSVLKIPDDQAIEANLVSKAIEDAQSKIEGMNFDLRKHILEYDDVLNKHRETIYRKRKEILETENWKEKIENWLKTEEEKVTLEEKMKEFGQNFNSAAKFVSLRILDAYWMDHLENMEYLRDSVRLRAYGQQDPLIEYKNEGHKMFQNLLKMIESAIVQTLFKVGLTKEASVSQPMPVNTNQPKNLYSKTGRNDHCPCGSGKKYKKCHGK